MIAFKSMLVLVLSMLSAIAAAPVSTEEGLTKLEQKVKMLELGRRLARLEGVHKNNVKEKVNADASSPRQMARLSISSRVSTLCVPSSHAAHRADADGQGVRCRCSLTTAPCARRRITISATHVCRVCVRATHHTPPIAPS